MNTSRIKNISTNIFIIFMILQPIFDIYYLYSDSVIEFFKFSPSTIIRMIVMSILFITSFLWFKNKKKYKYLIAFSVVFIIYAIMHNFNSLAFDVEYGNYTYSIFKEIFYLIRMLMPLILVFITYEKQISFKQASIIIVLTTLIFSIIMILTNIFEIAITSYNDGNKIIKANIFDWFNKDIYKLYGYEYIASKGIFHMANQISATFICLLPLNIYIFLKDKKHWNIITIFLLMISMLMLGTRIASYGAILVFLGMFLLYIFFEKIYLKNKLQFNKILLLILILVPILFIFNYSPVLNRKYVEDDFGNIEENFKQGNVLKKLNEFNKKINIAEKNAKTIYEFKKIKEEKVKYVKNNYKLFGIDEEYITELYPYNQDVDFWLEEMKVPYLERANHRELKSHITKRIINLNDNKVDSILGISFTRMRNAQIYMENDIAVHYYSIGIIGILIFICPYFWVIIYTIINIFKNKQNFNFLNVTLVFSISLIILSGILSGNVFDEWIVTLFLGFLSGLLLINIKNNQKNIKI